MYDTQPVERSAADPPLAQILSDLHRVRSDLDDAAGNLIVRLQPVTDQREASPNPDLRPMLRTTDPGGSPTVQSLIEIRDHLAIIVDRLRSTTARLEV